MNALLRWTARLAAVAGIAVIALAAVARLAGAFRFGGFEVGTLLQAGMAAMLLACLAYLAVLVESRPR